VFLPQPPRGEEHRRVESLAQLFRHLPPHVHPPSGKPRPQRRREPVPAKALQETMPQFPRKDAGDQQVVDRLILLTAERAIRRVLEAMPLPSAVQKLSKALWLPTGRTCRGRMSGTLRTRSMCHPASIAK
jgi:hypothetical protein